MCLRVKDNAYIEIAKEDILCYKFVKHGFLNLFWHSLLYEKKARRKYNKVLKAVDHLKLECEGLGSRSSDFFIGPGFHAFRTISAPQHSRCTKFAVIPKGAEYCYGEYDDVVATEIIVFRTKRQFYKYLKKNELQ